MLQHWIDLTYSPAICILIAFALGGICAYQSFQFITKL